MRIATRSTSRTGAFSSRFIPTVCRPKSVRNTYLERLKPKTFARRSTRAFRRSGKSAPTCSRAATREHNNPKHKGNDPLSVYKRQADLDGKRGRDGLQTQTVITTGFALMNYRSGLTPPSDRFRRKQRRLRHGLMTRSFRHVFLIGSLFRLVRFYRFVPMVSLLSMPGRLACSWLQPGLLWIARPLARAATRQVAFTTSRGVFSSEPS